MTRQSKAAFWSVLLVVLVAIGFIQELRMERKLQEFNEKDVRWAKDMKMICDEIGIDSNNLPSNQ